MPFTITQSLYFLLYLVISCGVSNLGTKNRNIFTRRLCLEIHNILLLSLSRFFLRKVMNFDYGTNLASYTNIFLKIFIFFALTAYIPTTATIIHYWIHVVCYCRCYCTMYIVLYLFAVVSIQQLLSIWVQFVSNMAPN